MRKNWRNKLTLLGTRKEERGTKDSLVPRTSSLVPFILMLLLSFTNCTNRKAETHETYTCPMHATVVSDKPGTCPVCGMDLVRKVRPGEEVKITEDLARLIKSPNEVVVSSIKTIKGEFKTMPVSVEALGIVTYDTRNIYTIPARIGGRLEKVFLKYAFQPVRKGQKVVEIYSPELLTAQRELLYLIENDPGNTTIIESAKNKLYLLGATQNQVSDLIRRKEVTSTFAIYSPYDGYIMTETQSSPSVPKPLLSSSSMGMDGSSNASSSVPVSTYGNTLSPEMIREGSYVSVGQTLFKVVNASALRIELDLPTSQAGRLNQNDEVDLDLGNKKIVKGKVDFVQPFFTEGEEFVKIRLYVRNSEDFQIGQLVRATIQMKPVEALWVPREAVLDIGLDKVVFIKERGVFKPNKVEAGIQVHKWIQIVRGISSSEEIASNAQYLVDSESFIKADDSQHNSEASVKSDTSHGIHDLVLNESQVKLANITTQKVSVKPVGQTVVVNARLTGNEALTEVVSSRVSGRIEKLFVKETGRLIRAGEPLYELYSETLLTLQREYLLAREQYETLGKEEPRYESFLKASERKLLLYGLSKKQITELGESKTVQQRITFLAPAGGIVSELKISEGQYIEEGALLYRIENLSRLWIEAELYPNESSLAKVGDKLTVRVNGFESTPQEANVVFLSPEYRGNSQITIMRAVLENQGMKFKPGMEAQVLFTHSSRAAVAIPVDAVIRDGRGTHVYVETGTNTFQPRMVKTGLEDFDQVEITEGLQEGDRIAVTGAYLLYSEIILRKGSDPMAGHQH